MREAAKAAVGQAPATMPTANSAMFVKAIERLEEVIELETRTLRQHKSTDLNEFNRRKRHGLLELNRIMRAIHPIGASGELVERLNSLRAKLEQNRAVLQTHLKAVQEIAGIVARAIQEQESDGTYSVSADFNGRRR